MGQYYYIINLDKKQYLDPHRFGNGLKLLEFSCYGTGVMTGLAVLLSDGNGRGGGDLFCDDPIIGSWAGDQIVVAGDYADKGNFLIDDEVEDWRNKVDVKRYKKGFDPNKYEPNIYEYAETCMEDISGKVIIAMCADESIRRDMLTNLIDGFANSTEKNKSLTKEIIQTYKCKKLVDEIKESIDKHWREIRSQNEWD